MRLLFLLSVSGFFYGCVATPPESSMGEAGAVPSKWSATREAKSGVDTDWVRRFGDRNLNGLVNEALANNHDMRIAAERVLRAGEAAYVSNATSKPQVVLSGDGERRKNVFVGFPFGGSMQSKTYGVDLRVDWEPDIWGVARAGKSAALAEWQAGGLDYRAARASLAAQVCKAWFALAEANHQVTLAKDALVIRFC